MSLPRGGFLATCAFLLMMVVLACTQRDATSPPIAPAPEKETVDAASALAAAAPVDAGPPHARPSLESDDPRSCNFDMPEQSCVAGEDAVNWGCRVDCANTCIECDRKCGDDGVIACEDACRKTRDTCASTCPAQVEEFRAMVRANYGCKPKRDAFTICKRTMKCLAACGFDANNGEPPATACQAKCEKAQAPGCSREFMDNFESLGGCIAYDYSP